MSAASTQTQRKQVMAQYQAVREQMDDKYAKLAQVNADRNEHELVISQLTQLAGDTRCWHQVGAVLAEKKVAQLIPVLQHTAHKLEEAGAQLSRTIERLEQSARQLETRYTHNSGGGGGGGGSGDE
eukprot:TRINITY_DN1258_c0_g1_i1.p2 TRINITY_DN1258_c0_g1~~TRINITY_DN1258_c0_g1_i1.p2  ORF type:complete len:126 (+),score=34.48 TRINITY_DN1258_c0_g1_i1:170-547(+)